MAPEALTRRLIAGLLACWCAIGCSNREDSITATWDVDPASPVVGVPAVVRVRLHPAGPVTRGARLRLEAHMSHPGMAPVSADTTERADGVYESRVTVSMVGDWTLVVSGALANGTRITRSTQVRAVASPDVPAARN
jgi:hypothetical protein